MVNPVYTNKALATKSWQYNCSIKYRENAVQTGLSRGLKGGNPTIGLTSSWPATSQKEIASISSL
jgi:hypothetical protein